MLKNLRDKIGGDPHQSKRKKDQRSQLKQTQQCSSEGGVYKEDLRTRKIQENQGYQAQPCYYMGFVTPHVANAHLTGQGGQGSCQTPEYSNTNNNIFTNISRHCQSPPKTQSGPLVRPSNLMMIDRLYVRQKREKLELVTGFETRNKYEVFDSQQQIMWANETTGRLATVIGSKIASTRPFNLMVEDMMQNEVIHLQGSGGFFNPLLEPQSMIVFSPPGTLVGSIKQKMKVKSTVFKVVNDQGFPVLKVKGPKFVMIGTEPTYKVIDLRTTEQVGQILKTKSGLMKHIFTDEDNFEIHFYPNLQGGLNNRLLMIGICFLLDFMFFE